MTTRDLRQTIDTAIDRFDGDVNELARAFGALPVSRQYGWRPRLLMLGRSTDGERLEGQAGVVEQPNGDGAGIWPP